MKSQIKLEIKPEDALAFIRMSQRYLKSATKVSQSVQKGLFLQGLIDEMVSDMGPSGAMISSEHPLVRSMMTLAGVGFDVASSHPHEQDVETLVSEFIRQHDLVPDKELQAVVKADLDASADTIFNIAQSMPDETTKERALLKMEGLMGEDVAERAKTAGLSDVLLISQAQEEMKEFVHRVGALEDTRQVAQFLDQHVNSLGLPSLFRVHLAHIRSQEEEAGSSPGLRHS